MTPKDIAKALDQMREVLLADVLRDVDGRIEQFRRAVYVKNEWCCNDMTLFATKVWGSAKPRERDTFGSVAYQLRGYSVNYCPFCGVSFAAPLAQPKAVSA